MAKKITYYRDAMEYLENDDIDLSGNGNPFSRDPDIECKNTNQEPKIEDALPEETTVKVYQNGIPGIFNED